MKRFPALLVALLLLPSLTLPAQTTPGRFFAPSSVDLQTLLPNPPANDSATTRQELDLILQEQKTRTPEEIARIQREVHLDVYLFDTVFGSWFTAKNLPVTDAFFTRVGETIRPVVMSAKKFWDRPRPPLFDPQVHPPIELPKNASYPSGHSTFGNLYALVLAQLAPDLKEPLLARGRQIGTDRILGGVHYPSDVAAGETLAHALFAKLMASPAFVAELAQAKAELDAARAKHMN